MDPNYAPTRHAGRIDPVDAKTQTRVRWKRIAGGVALAFFLPPLFSFLFGLVVPRIIVMQADGVTQMREWYELSVLARKLLFYGLMAAIYTWFATGVRWRRWQQALLLYLATCLLDLAFAYLLNNWLGSRITVWGWPAWGQGLIAMLVGTWLGQRLATRVRPVHSP